VTTFETRLRDAIHKALARNPTDGSHRYVSTWQINSVLAAVLAELGNSAPILAVPDMNEAEIDALYGRLREHRTPRFLVNLPAPTFHTIAPKQMPDGSIVVALPPDGALVRHRHVWHLDKTIVVRSWKGRCYRCAFKYLDGSVCDQIWTTYGGAQMHDWGERMFTSGPYFETPPQGDLFDQIEKAAADYRYEHRLPFSFGPNLKVIVTGNMGALRAAAGARGLPVVSDDDIVMWLQARGLELAEVHGPTGPAAGIMVYQPGTFVAGKPKRTVTREEALADPRGRTAPYPKPGCEQCDGSGVAGIPNSIALGPCPNEACWTEPGPGRVRLPENAVAEAIAAAPRRYDGEDWTITVQGASGEQELAISHVHCWRPSMEDGQFCLWVDPDGQRCAVPWTLAEGSSRTVWWSMPRTIAVSSVVEPTEPS